MIKIKKGTNRVTIILFSWIVIKFPRWSDPYGTGGFSRFLIGFHANIVEGWLWRRTRWKLLQPTLCLGICNIQRYAGDVIPDLEEIEDFLGGIMSEKNKRYRMCVDPHDLWVNNWRKTKTSLVLIDYGGSPPYRDASTSHLLFSVWRDEQKKEASKLQ